MGLLGFGNKNAQQEQMYSLLGVDPSAMRRQALFNGLAAAGFTLMGDKNPGNAGLAFVAGTDRARNDYMQTAMDAYRVKQAEENQQYQRGRDAKDDAWRKQQWDYQTGRQNRADAWDNTQRGRQMEEWQRQDDTLAGQQNAVQDWTQNFQSQGGNLFSPEMQMGLRQQGIEGVNPADTQKYNRMQPYTQAGMYPEAFQQMAAQPEKSELMSVGKGSSLYNPSTDQWVTPPTGAANTQAIDDPMKISKDYQTQPGFERVKQIAPTVQSMVKSLEDPSAMADLDFVYGLAKILDPTSVVRESEAGMVIDSQGIGPSLLGQMNKILSGEQAMLPEIRQKLVGVAIRRANELKAQAEQERAFYANMAVQNGYNPETYLQAVPVIPGLPTDEEGWSVLPNGTRIRQREQ